jgi:hypothetical protein
VQQVVGTTSGLARFTGDDTGDAVVALYDSPDLEELRRVTLDALDAAGVAPVLTHGYTPHMTLGYVQPGDDLPVQRLDPVPLTFTALTVMHGTDRTDVPFGEAAPDVVPPAATPTDGGPAVTDIAHKDIDVPGLDGPGPFPCDYARKHLYARDVESEDGACVCSAGPGHALHCDDEGKAFGGNTAPPFKKKGDATTTSTGKNKGDSMSGDTITAGTFVASGGVKGRVDLVVTNGTVPGATGSDDQPVEGSATAPAARVVVYDSAGAGVWKASSRKIASKVSGLRRTAPLRTGQAKSVDESVAAILVQYDGVGDGTVALPDAATVRQVFDRGAGAWPGEAKTLLTRDEWAMCRVEAFLHTVTGARPDGYRGDDDLLPAGP